MGCFHPLEGWYSKEVNSSGKRSIVFDQNKAMLDGMQKPLRIPCGQCDGCRYGRSKQWAIRCVHEAQLHKHNCFITLTYNNENLPKGRTLVKKHFQDFMKRLRRKYGNDRIRYFHCGEYGSNTQRPHYHACLFGFDFPDKVYYKEALGNKLYTSKILEDTWGKGYCVIGDVTFDSAAYVARYIMKKINVSKASPDSIKELHFHRYNEIDYSTGELIVEKQKEYTTMSRRPGIGKRWLEKYSSDVYPSDSVKMKGIPFRPPSYYDYLFDIENPEEFKKIKQKRLKKIKEFEKDNTNDRLLIKEKVFKNKYNLFKKRSYEDEES